MTSSKMPSSTKNNRTILIIFSGIVVTCFCLLLITAGISLFLTFPSSNPSSKTAEASGGLDQQANGTPRPTPNPDKQTWLVMFYFDADDPTLEEDIFFDFNEVELVGSTGRVKMVAQIDRLKGMAGDKGSSARRYDITQDSDLTRINSRMVADLGEVDMDNSQTLIDFTTWAIQTYPADKYVLILSDHGMGWPGGWTDATPQHDPIQFISLSKLDKSLKTIIDQTGIGQFELIGMDACLMSMLEVYNALAPYSHYAVASQETEPGVGWAYSEALKTLTQKPGISGADLGESFVNTYISKDQRILDDKARTNLISSYGFPAKTSADELIRGFSTEITLAAVDLSAIPAVNKALNSLALEMKTSDQKKVADARSYTRSFTNVFSDNGPSPYIDLGHFAALIAAKSGNDKIFKAASGLQSAIKKAVIAEKHGPQRQGAMGISIYFPVSDLYWNDGLSGYDLYKQFCSRFAEATLWDDFLAFHYAKQDFGLGNPSKAQKIPAPGTADIKITPLELSANTVTTGQEVTIKTEISGDQIAYIYLLSLYKKDDNHFLVYTMDYIQGQESRQENGVYYPVWQQKNGVIPINLTWKPFADGVCNGATCAFTLLEPESYGAQKEDIIYSAAGKYIYTGDEQSIDGRMFFSNDTTNMTRITGFSGDMTTGRTARDIIPKQGDRWLNLETWIEKDAQGQNNTVYHEGWELPFGSTVFYFRQHTPDPGNYQVAIMVEDMDGKRSYQFAPLTITP